MNKIAIAFSTKDRVELSKQSVEPLLQPNKFDLFWSDGSTSLEAENLGAQYEKKAWFQNVRGGADAAIAFNLTTMLGKTHCTKNDCEGITIKPVYDYVGLVENDVLLDPGWFEPAMELFEKGKQDGLEVGAVSARSYADRVLVQRDGYAVMHNLGAGQVIFSRYAASLVLAHFRTGWTLENRRVFAQLTGKDIGAWWAFRGSQHMLVADWGFDRVLAAHGLASLALTPAKCQMIGQEPPLEQQGLKLTDGPVEELRDDKAFELYRERTAAIRAGELKIPCDPFLRSDDGTWTIFPHQLGMLGGRYEGDWKLKWSQGFGPFSWESVDAEHVRGYAGASMCVPITGPCVFLVSGGAKGGKIQIADEALGSDSVIDLEPQGDTGRVMQVAVPAAISYRNARLTALSPGVVFYGITCREPQLVVPNKKFDHSWLPAP